MSVKPEVELIFTIAHTENTFNVKYLDNGAGASTINLTPSGAAVAFA